ncbi:MAG: RagB/SusD family nutrient uptake outer membrane protein [Prolixibacteraceae bacterium]|nr:RagB/SusD family nutrient uptake outer membrane protein [Prolixibacteraceae bacterium]
MKKIFKTIVALSLLLLSVSCDNEGFFELERPNQYPWTKVKELELAVRQPYLLLMGNAWGSPVGALGLRGFAESDISQYLNGITGSSYFYEYYNRLWKTTTLNTSDKELELAFGYLYQISTATNAPLKLINDAEKAGKDVFENMTETDRQTVKRYKGELLFLRAVCYWYLARTWAPPYNPAGPNTGKYFVLRRDYVNGADDIKNGSLATVEEVYSSIVQDLKDAVDVLPTSYVTSELSQRSRVNKYAAQAMLARVYFYMGKTALAKAQLDDVINSKMYNLNDDPIEAFNRVAGEGSSGEIIWEIALSSTSSKFDRIPTIFSKNNYTANGGRGTSWNHCAWACFTLSYNTLKQIGWMNNDLSVGTEAAKDKRYTQTFIRLEAYKANPWSSSANPVEYFTHLNTYETRYSPITTPHVWQDKHFRAKTSGRRSNRAMLRLAEMYLTRSIIRFKDGDKVGAAEDLNVVRHRAGLDNISSADITELAIENERIKELAGEHADRLYYLIALRKPIGIGDRDPSKFSPIQPPYSDYYWQVPLVEQQQNKAYQQ